MIPLIKSLFQQRKSSGNSLTFLLGSITIIGLSLSMTTMMIAPTLAKGTANTSLSSGIKLVAERHLDKIEAYIKANPDKLSNLVEEAAIVPDDGSPAYQKIDLLNVTDAFPFSYSESIKVNGIDTDVISTAPTSGDSYALVRFTQQPYQNSLKLTVQASGGILTTTRSRIVSMAPEGCAIDKTPVPLKAYFSDPSNDEKDFSLNTLRGSQGTYNFLDTQEPYIQLGRQRVCELPPHDGTLPPGETLPNVSCIFDAPAVYYIHGGEAKRSNGLRYRFVFTLHPGAGNTDPTNDTKPDLDTLELRVKTETSPGVFTAYTEDAANLTPYRSAPESVAIKVFPPAASDSTQTYAAAIIYKERSTNKLYLTWAKWNSSGILTEGLFAATPAAPTEIFAGSLDYVSSWAFHAPTNQIVGAGLTASGRRVIVKKLDPPANPASDEPAIDSAFLSQSSIPTASTPSAFLLDPTNVLFGKPVVSRDGEFVLLPIRTNAEPNEADDDTSDGYHISVMAFNIKNALIGSSNNYTTNTSTGSNVARLMRFSRSAYNSNSSKGADINNLHQIYVWHNNENNKFYWVIRKAFPHYSTRFLYEWDPKTWGMGPSSGSASEWKSNTGSLPAVKKNIRFIGANPTNTTTTSDYTGTYFTVRKIASAPGSGDEPLWTECASGCAIDRLPQVVYDKTSNAYWFWNANVPLTSPDSFKLFRISLDKGYQPLFYLSPDTEVKGRTVAVDPRGGWVYYTKPIDDDGATPPNDDIGVLYAYHPAKAPDSLKLPLLWSSMDFGEGFGDGNLYYSLNNKTLYTIQTNDNPKSGMLLVHKPYCSVMGDVESWSGETFGFPSASYATAINEFMPSVTDGQGMRAFGGASSTEGD